MSGLPACPKCESVYTYEDGLLLVCPECAHEWSPTEPTAQQEVPTVKDAHGQILQEGDTVTLIKDLKIKGASTVIKVGTKAKNIRFVDGDHDLDCRVDGVGPMLLKSEFVKKA